MVWPQIIYSNSKWLLWLIFNLIFRIIRNVFWLANGTYGQIWTNRKPENYASSAHVMRIVFSHRFDMFLESRLSDFCLLHDSFVPPEYVLKDEATLLQITDTQAVFVEAIKGSKPHFLYPFSILGMHGAPKKVITMPLQSFNKLAETMERDDAKIIFLQNQARCGGTLFTGLFKATDRCITFNEPHVLNSLCKYHHVHGTWNRDVARRMTRNIINVLCKPYRSLPQKPLAYVIKPTVTSIHCSDLIQEVLPEAVQFFIYRDPINVGISLRRLGAALSSLMLLYALPNIPNTTAFLLRFLGYCDLHYRGWTPKVGQEIEFGYRTAAITMRVYLRYRRKGVKLHGIRFETLRDNQDDLAHQIFELCGMPMDLVGKAVEAFKEDSQGDTFFSREKLAKLIPNPPKATPDILEACRGISKELDVPGPDCWELKFNLDGSLLPKS